MDIIKFLLIYFSFNMIFVIKLVFFYGKSFKETIKNNKSEFLKSIISIFLFGTIFYLSFEIINVYYNHKYFNKNRRKNKRE